MAIYEFRDSKFSEIRRTSFSGEQILERVHLQAAVKEQIDIIAPDCLVIAEEFSEWPESQRRIDLLAIDKDANIVVIELKRNDTGEHMDLQSLRYAAMVSTLTFEHAVKIYQKHLVHEGQHGEQAESSLLDFLGWDEAQESDFGIDARIVLASSNFSKELTTSVMWLNERNINIRCVRLIPYKLQDKVLIDVQQIIPLPESENYQIKTKEKAEQSRAAKKSKKDFSKYKFEGSIYNKRNLVLAVVKKWVFDNKPQNFEDLTSAFPNDTRKGRMFEIFDRAEEIANRDKDRHFIKPDEVFEFPNSPKYALSNQWGGDNMDRFITRAADLGFKITKQN